MLSKHTQNEIRLEIDRLRREIEALESVLRSVGAEPQQRGPGRPRKTESTNQVPSGGSAKQTRNWSAAGKARATARVKARWKAAKDAGFSNLASFAASKAGKAWAERNA